MKENESDKGILNIYSTKESDNEVEYIRKDAFIEKALNAYCKVCGHYHHTVPYEICRHDCNYYDDFKKHLKEE